LANFENAESGKDWEYWWMEASEWNLVSPISAKMRMALTVSEIALMGMKRGEEE
jgi:hypothetical protein